MEKGLNNSSQYKQGILYALLCYGAWGMFPLFWKMLTGIPAVNVLAHRVIWSAVFLLLWVMLSKQRTVFLSYLRRPKYVGILGLAGAIICFNWGTYIYAVETNRIVEAGLGYYINPLINVLLGYLFLGERLGRTQKLAVLLALIGVGYLTYTYGRLPWISLILATSFGVYGLLKKKVGLEAMPALTIETTVMMLPALFYLFYMSNTGQQPFFPESFQLSGLLMLGGVITAIPLFWFGKAAQTVPLSTLGFIQYLSPTVQLLLGVLLYGEHFSPAHLICFICVWTGLTLYTLSVIRGRVVRIKGER